MDEFEKWKDEYALYAERDITEADCLAAFNAGREAGMREAAAIVGTLAERPYDSMPEFDAILHAESAVLSAI